MNDSTAEALFESHLEQALKIGLRPQFSDSDFTVRESASAF